MEGVQMSDTPISDSTPHNVAELGMLCRSLERDLTAANKRIAQLEHEIELFREHADYEDVCLVEAILKGEEIGRKENQL
jgi:bacterioferritin (cytochrome b1)